MVPNQLLAANLNGKITNPNKNLFPNSPTEATYLLENFLSQLIGVITLVAVLFFIAQIIFAGYAFISSQGDEKTMEATRKRLTEAILGLAIVIIAVGMGSLVAFLFGIPDILNIKNIFTKLNL